jgi:hypothetical protein
MRGIAGQLQCAVSALHMRVSPFPDAHSAAMRGIARVVPLVASSIARSVPIRASTMRTSTTPTPMALCEAVPHA